MNRLNVDFSLENENLTNNHCCQLSLFSRLLNKTNGYQLNGTDTLLYNIHSHSKLA